MSISANDPQPSLATSALSFLAPVPANGYRWWYLDALSDDGRCGMTIILFVGSVFSPYYFRARRKGLALAENHCSANVIFYGPDRKRWAMTERGQHDLSRTDQHFQVGNTVACVNGDQLQIDIDERCVPLPSKLRGRIVCQLPALNPHCYSLDTHLRHRWWPMAPHMPVAVELSNPKLAWSGSGYLDSNAGTEPLEQGFKHWQWQRSELQAGQGSITYVARRRDDTEQRIQLTFDGKGVVSQQPSSGLQPQALPAGTVWRMPRVAYAEGDAIELMKTYEDTPFYTRSLLRSRGAVGEQLVMHESLDLDRFVRPWVQRLLPFRMPRWAS